jgi:hypothetical protein
MTQYVVARQADAFVPVQVTLTLDSQEKLNAFAALVNYSYVAAVAVEDRNRTCGTDGTPGVNFQTIDNLFPYAMLKALEDQGADCGQT